MSDTSQTTPEQRLETLAVNLQESFGSKGCEILCSPGEVSMLVPCDQLIEVATALRDAAPFQFEELIDICGVDYSTYGQSEWETSGVSHTGFGRGVEKSTVILDSGSDRFAVVYHLLSVSNNLRLRLRVFVNTEHPIVASVIGIWHVADWFEREAFDLFGILFDGHPDLRRILTDYGFVGHPFCKDFPLTGHVEMRYDPEQKRVIYEPVTIEQRTQVPRVIRDDSRYPAEKQAERDSADA